jgi:type II secretory pathway pseudopilin PulG
MAARIRALLAREDGMTIPELLTAMSILAFVITGILVLFVSGLNATTQMNARFQAQQDARLALSSLRYEVGFACSASQQATPPGVVLLLPDATSQACSGSANYVTWCADSASGAPYGLYRQTGQTCSSSTGVKRAGSLNTNSVFSILPCTSGTRQQLQVTLPVNANLGTSTVAYQLSDTITMRNAPICP